MIGTAKLSTIREQLRESFKMTDAELLAWFNQQMQDLAQKPKPVKSEIDTLRLLRDAPRQGNKARGAKAQTPCDPRPTMN